MEENSNNKNVVLKLKESNKIKKHKKAFSSQNPNFPFPKDFIENHENNEYNNNSLGSKKNNHARLQSLQKNLKKNSILKFETEKCLKFLKQHQNNKDFISTKLKDFHFKFLNKYIKNGKKIENFPAQSKEKLNKLILKEKTSEECITNHSSDNKRYHQDTRVIE